MDIDTRDRTVLKSYFLKNKIPTESNFAELVDGMLNQKEDGIVKLPANPLSIEAAGDAGSQKKAINFYSSFADEKPAWSLSLNPRSDPGNPNSARVGFTISDGEGNHRLFIDRNTGDVGIGTLSPQRAVHIRDGVLRVDRSTNSADVMMVRTKADGTVLRCFGVGVDAAESDADSHHFSIHDFGTNVGGRNTKRLVIDGTGNVGIGEQDPQAKLHVSMPGASPASILRIDSDIRTNADVTQGIHLFKKLDGALFGWKIEGSGIMNSTATLKFISSQHGVDRPRLIIARDSGNVGIGEEKPEATLDINGSLRVGKGTTMTRIVVGHVNSNGSRNRGSGFTSRRTNTGTYTLTFSPSLPSVPTIIATCGGNEDNTISVMASSTTEATVFSYDVDPNKNAVPQDAEFHFIAISV